MKFYTNIIYLCIFVLLNSGCGLTPKKISKSPPENFKSVTKDFEIDSLNLALDILDAYKENNVEKIYNWMATDLSIAKVGKFTDEDNTQQRAHSRTFQRIMSNSFNYNELGQKAHLVTLRSLSGGDGYIAVFRFTSIFRVYYLGFAIQQLDQEYAITDVFDYQQAAWASQIAERTNLTRIYSTISGAEEDLSSFGLIYEFATIAVTMYELDGDKNTILSIYKQLSRPYKDDGTLWRIGLSNLVRKLSIDQINNIYSDITRLAPFDDGFSELHVIGTAVSTNNIEEIKNAISRLKVEFSDPIGMLQYELYIHALYTENLDYMKTLLTTLFKKNVHDSFTHSMLLYLAVKSNDEKLYNLSQALLRTSQTNVIFDSLSKRISDSDLKDKSLKYLEDELKKKNVKVTENNLS